MNKQDITIILKEFNKLFCNSYPGDSGLGGNDPQEPVDDWACYPNDVRKWLSSTLETVSTQIRKEERERIKLFLYCRDWCATSGMSEECDCGMKNIIASLTPQVKEEWCACCCHKQPHTVLSTCIDGCIHCQPKEECETDPKLPSKSDKSVMTTEEEYFPDIHPNACECSICLPLVNKQKLVVKKLSSKQFVKLAKKVQKDLEGSGK